MGHQVGWQEDREYVRKEREKEIIVWLNQLSPQMSGAAGFNKPGRGSALSITQL